MGDVATFTILVPVVYLAGSLLSSNNTGNKEGLLLSSVSDKLMGVDYHFALLPTSNMRGRFSPPFK